MITGGFSLQIIEHNSAQYQQMVALRYEVLRKPLGLQFTDEQLQQESNCLLLGLFEAGEIQACCILMPVETDNFQLKQMAVSPNQQGQGLGALLMQFAENQARVHSKSKIILHARKTALEFYKKCGYSVVGNEFEEVGIPHFVMEKLL